MINDMIKYYYRPTIYITMKLYLTAPQAQA